MSVPPKVSIVITCHDLGAYLQEALDSCAGYDGPHTFEVVVVDDGSRDPSTRGVISALDRERYVVIEQPNMGLAKARNNGIARARGEYIISLDVDNRIHPVFLKRGIAILDAHSEVGVVYGDSMYFGGRSGRRIPGSFDLARLLKENYIDACACFRRSVWEQLGGYDEHMPHMGWEDWDFWLRCAVAGVTFQYVDEILFDYRVRAGSMIEETKKHQAELNAYIFSKPELRFLEPLRERYIRLLEGSREHLSGRELIALLWKRIGRRFIPGARAKGKTGG